MQLDRKYNYFLFAGVLLFCFFISVGVRYKQFETWKTNPSAFFVGERPMMTTLDAPYWLRWAREINEGTYGQKGALGQYPSRTKTFIERSVSYKFIDQPNISINSTSDAKSSPTNNSEVLFLSGPLISRIIAILVPFFNYNYYLTGTLVIPVMASLFILPLGIYFFRIGAPSSGLLGGLIGTFSSAYYMRSSIGRIDTDMLNLFFPILTALFILLASGAIKERYVLLYSAIAGLSLFMFNWWYPKPAFALAYFVVLILSLFINKIRLRTILLSSLLLLLCSQPFTFMMGTDSLDSQLSRYFVIDDSTTNNIKNKISTPANFPNTMTTISEVDHVPMNEVFRRVLSNTTLDWMGFIGFFGLVVFKWRVLLPLAPLLGLGLLSFQSSNRFIMFLAPFIGIGLGWLLQLLVDMAFYVLTQRGKGAKNTHSAADKTKNGIKGKKGKGKVIKTNGSRWAKLITSFSIGSYANVEATKDSKNTKSHRQIVVNEGSSTNTSFKDEGVSWWDWGRQGVLYLGISFFFWLISGQTAISFVPRPSINTELYATFLEVKKRVPEGSVLLTWWDYGHTLLDLGFDTFHDGGSQFTPKTYLIARGLISPDQGELYDITQYLATEGNRGIAETNTSPEAFLAAVLNPQQKPLDPIYLFFTADMTPKYGAISKLGSWDIVNGGSKPKFYQILACNKFTNEKMECRGAIIDLKTGKINNQLALQRLVFIRDGKVLQEQTFGRTQGYTLQLLVSGQRILEVQLIDEEVYRSNYNQMFLLGKYRKDLYDETYNAFPFSRLFKIKF
jgi:hypothetical protein